jgi:hypothetical protein
MANMNAPILRLVERGDAAFKEKHYEKAEHLYTQALELAVQSGAETNYVYSCLVKVYKKSEKHQQAYKTSLHAVPTPAGFRDCSICLRQLVKQATKAEDDSLIIKWLEEFYRLGVLAYLCYETSDCSKGVYGPLYDRAVILCQRLELRQISATYPTHGTLAEGGLLTKRDYKLFASTFGETSQIYNPILDFSALTREVNNEFIRWLRQSYLEPPKENPEYGNDPFWIRLAEQNIASTIEQLKRIAPFVLND